MFATEHFTTVFRRFRAAPACFRTLIIDTTFSTLRKTGSFTFPDKFNLLLREKWTETCQPTPLSKDERTMLWRIMMTPVMQSAYAEMLDELATGVTLDFYQSFISRYLYTACCCPLLDLTGCYGMTQTTGTIILDKPVSDSQAVAMGVTVVTFAHEVSHALRRNRLTKVGEYLAFSTPPKLTERPLLVERIDKYFPVFREREAGRFLEEKLFGARVESLVPEGAQVLFQIEKFTNISDFRTVFLSANVLSEGTMGCKGNMMRDSVGKVRICGWDLEG